MKNKKLLLSLAFVLICSVICLSTLIKKQINISSNEYTTTKIDGFEMSLFGSTGWAAVDLPLYASITDTNSPAITVTEGEPFMILGESGDYWEIQYGNYHGYIEHAYCMINLPDVVPSIKYNITNASGSIYRSSGYDITSQSIYGDNSHPEYNVTGEKLYSAEKIQNNKIGREEYIVPSLYSTAKMIAKAQVLALQNGKSLMIYDSYRPVSVSKKVSNALQELKNHNQTVANGLSGWDITWFIATINPGVNMSAHNVGTAIDVSLWDNVAEQEVTDMPTAMHELSNTATRCSNANCNSYSTGMANSESAMLLSNIMTDSNVGMGTLASEWWHYQDNAGLNRMKTKTGTVGRDFQVTSIVSDIGIPSNLTVVGDLNSDGLINGTDAELIYKLYKVIQTNNCKTCDDLVHYADTNGNGQVDLNDIFEVLNSNVDSPFVTSIYNINDDYIYIGANTPDDSIISLLNYQDISSAVSNNKYLIKYKDEVIKEYDIGYISGTNLNNGYVFENDVNSIQTTNCTVTSDANKVYVSHNDTLLENFDIVGFTYKGTISGTNINVTASNISNFLNDIQFKNITGCVYNGTECLVQGNFAKGDKLYIKYNDNVIKQYNLKFLITSLDAGNIGGFEMEVGDTFQFDVTITPAYSDEEIVWECTNAGEVATVDQTGLVSAIGEGTSIISVKTLDNRVYDYITINVISTPKYTVTYRNGDATTTREYTEGQQVQINNPTKPGYIFKGWKYNNKIYTLGDELLMPNKNIELIAEWELTNSNISTYNVTNNIIEKVPINKNISNFIQELGLDSSVYNVKIYDKNNTEKQNENIVTGDKVKITLKDNTQVSEYYISVYGDVNCDGELSVGDIRKIYNYLFNDFNEVPDYIKKAADYNNDGEQSVGDIVKIYRALINS